MDASSISRGFNSLFNTSMALLPAREDIYMAVPRLIARLPPPLDSLVGLLSSPKSVIAHQTQAMANASSVFPSAVTNFTQSSSPLPTPPPFAAQGFLSSFSQIMSTHRYSNIDGIFSYLASKWAIATFIIVGTCKLALV